MAETAASVARPGDPAREASESSLTDTTDTEVSSPSPRSTSSIEKEGAEKDDSGYLYDVKTVGPLAPSDAEIPTPGRALLVALGLIKRGRAPELDAVSKCTMPSSYGLPPRCPPQVATRESVFDGPLASYYKPHPKWENNAAFDPSLRWTYREERTARRKIDRKVFLWTLVMFLALNIVRICLRSRSR